MIAGVVVLALGAGVAACGSDDGDERDEAVGLTHRRHGRGGDGRYRDLDRELRLRARALEATAGGTITVTNTDDTAHTLTADDGAFDTGDIGGAGTATFTVGGPGRYRYHCDIHNYMTGTVTVSE